MEVKLKDLLKDGIYIKLKDKYRNKIFQRFLKKFKNKKLASEFLNLSGSHYINAYQNNKFDCPLSVLYKIVKYINEDMKNIEKNIFKNLFQLYLELKYQTYKTSSLKTFILRDPKTRKISKSEFRDRIIHHALCNIIEPIFDKTFIYDSYANRKTKGNLKAIERFYSFIRKISRNGKINGWFNKNQIKGYCLKADIKHYFREINHDILLKLINKKIKDEKTIWLIKKIIKNCESGGGANQKSMPLGNLTSQIFANIYLNELDSFIKQKLKAKYYIRYVDDFVILHPSKSQLKTWKEQINNFLINKLKLELHPEKSRIISLSKGIDFVGFRCFYYHKLLRKRNIRKMLSKLKLYKNKKLSHNKILEIHQGWQAYAKWANTYKLRKNIFNKIQL